MKQKVLPLIAILLLNSSQTVVANAVSHRQGSWTSHQGILDRAMRKMEKEEEMRKEAIEAQAQMQILAKHKQREQENYEKNYKRAEQEAKQIMMSETDNEIQGIRTELMTTPKPQPKESDMEKELEQPGFLGSFNQKMTSLNKLADGESERPEQKIQPQVMMQPMISPFGEQALDSVHQGITQAISQVFEQPQEAPISSSTLQRMKAKMHAKLNQRSVIPEKTKPTTLQSFNQLPVKKVPEETQKQMQSEDSVTSFLSQVDQQEKREQQERERQERDDDMRQSEFEKQVMYGDGQDRQQTVAQDDSDNSGSVTFENTSSQDESAPQENTVNPPKIKKEPVDENELPEDNPISAMMALKHPETVKAVEDATINEMAQGYKSAANRFVGIE